MSHFRVGDPAAATVAYRYYGAGPALTEAANREYERIADADYFCGLPKPEFVTKLADSWNEINVIHSFRESNTRSQFVFFSQLSENAGYEIDARRFVAGADLRDEFVAARFAGQATGRPDRLAAVLLAAIATKRG